MYCSNCRTQSPEGARTCHQCGAWLTGQVRASGQRQFSAERRHLTIMFVDLVESTVLSERLDPEDYRDIIRTYRDRCSEIATSYEAHIFGYSGRRHPRLLRLSCGA